MISTDVRLISLPILVGIFAASFVVLAVLASIVLYMLSLDVPSIGILVVLAAAGIAAQFWVSREKAIPASRRAWIAALVCGAVSTILFAVLMLAAFATDHQLWWEFRRASALMIGGFFAAILVLQILVVRFGFWLTFRQEAKKLA